MTNDERRKVDKVIWCALILIDTSKFTDEQKKYLDDFIDKFLAQKTVEYENEK